MVGPAYKHQLQKSQYAYASSKPLQLRSRIALFQVFPILYNLMSSSCSVAVVCPSSFPAPGLFVSSVYVGLLRVFFGLFQIVG